MESAVPGRSVWTGYVIVLAVCARATARATHRHRQGCRRHHQHTRRRRGPQRGQQVRHRPCPHSRRHPCPRLVPRFHRRGHPPWLVGRASTETPRQTRARCALLGDWALALLRFARCATRALTDSIVRMLGHQRLIARRGSTVRATAEHDLNQCRVLGVRSVQVRCCKSAVQRAITAHVDLPQECHVRRARSIRSLARRTKRASNAARACAAHQARAAPLRATAS